MIRQEKIQSLGNIPLVILSRGMADRLPGISVDDNLAYEKTWLAMQKELLALSPNSQQIIAEKSSHYIHLTQPELILDAVQSVLKQINGIPDRKAI